MSIPYASPVTTSSPVRAIKAKTRSRSEKLGARRAIEDPPAPAVMTRHTRQDAPADAAVESAFVAPGIGKPEAQLMVSFLLTAAIVFAFTVLLPFLLRLVRNF